MGFEMSSYFEFEFITGTTGSTDTVSNKLGRAELTGFFSNRAQDRHA